MADTGTTLDSPTVDSNPFQDPPFGVPVRVVLLLFVFTDCISAANPQAQRHKWIKKLLELSFLTAAVIGSFFYPPFHVHVESFVTVLYFRLYYQITRILLERDCFPARKHSCHAYRHGSSINFQEPQCCGTASDSESTIRRRFFRLTDAVFKCQYRPAWQYLRQEFYFIGRHLRESSMICQGAETLNTSFCAMWRYFADPGRLGMEEAYLASFGAFVNLSVANNLTHALYLWLCATSSSSFLSNRLTTVVCCGVNMVIGGAVFHGFLWLTEPYFNKDLAMEMWGLHVLSRSISLFSGME